jgi:dTDP-glucose 4,6-dehydratase
MTHVAILGASGFVGSTLLTADQPLAARLTLIDPVQPAPTVLRKSRRLCERVDVRQTDTLSGGGDPGDVDVMLVLAGKTNVDEALADPASAFTANCGIAIDVGDWWRRHPAARVVYLSSDEVLGVPERPLTEDAPYLPTQPYAASKAVAEMTLRCYSDTYGLDLIVIRSCNLVGGLQRAPKLVPIAVQKLAMGQPVPVFGTGLQMREYLAVEDLCDVLQMAVDNLLPPGIYNCTSAMKFTVLKVVELVATALGVPASYVHVTDRLVQDQVYSMDPSLLHTFGWQARFSPVEAMTAAAIDLYSAWQCGEDLMTPRRYFGNSKGEGNE